MFQYLKCSLFTKHCSNCFCIGSKSLKLDMSSGLSNNDLLPGNLAQSWTGFRLFTFSKYFSRDFLTVPIWSLFTDKLGMSAVVLNSSGCHSVIPRTSDGGDMGDMILCFNLSFVFINCLGFKILVKIMRSFLNLVEYFWYFDMINFTEKKNSF